MSGDGQGRGQDLARRLRAAIDVEQDARRRAEQERLERLRAAVVARAVLLKDLAAFGRALGHAKVSATDDVVVVRYDGRSLRFEAVGDADEVKVIGDNLDEGWRLRRNTELARWALHPPHGAPRLLFDAGLAELVARVFELRPAAEVEPVVPAPVTPRDETSGKPGGGGGRTL